MKTNTWAIALVFLSTLSAASGQLLIKLGVNNATVNLMSIITNIPLIIGYGLYGLSAVILVISLKYGELSVLYPIYAMNFIWVCIASPMIFPTDSMNIIKWAGVISIVLGVAFIGLGSRGEHHD